MSNLNAVTYLEQEVKRYVNGKAFKSFSGVERGLSDMTTWITHAIDEYCCKPTGSNFTEIRRVRTGIRNIEKLVSIDACRDENIRRIKRELTIMGSVLDSIKSINVAYNKISSARYEQKISAAYQIIESGADMLRAYCGTMEDEKFHTSSILSPYLMVRQIDAMVQLFVRSIGVGSKRAMVGASSLDRTIRVLKLCSDQMRRKHFDWSRRLKFDVDRLKEVV